jgi:heat shock protein HtpX
MKRIFLFLVTNLAVLALLSVVIFIIEQVFGVRLGQGSMDGLLIFAAIFGFGGALISLALSKWTAKRLLGVRRNAALVAVSSGLLRSTSRSQMEAVLGHEISHVANGDMVTLALPQGVLNTLVIFLARIIGSIVDRALFKNDRAESGSVFFLATMTPLDERIAALQSQELR